MVSRQWLRETLKPAAAVGAATALSVLCGACGWWPVDTKPHPIPLRAQIEARALGVFDAAVLVKPREWASADALAAGLAPLLFREAMEGSTRELALAPQVVFHRAGTLVLGGRAFPQMSYLWRAGDGADRTLRGVRITLDSRGLPVIWEVLDGGAPNDSKAVRVVFVAQSLEARARTAFGPPLPGRRFAVEAGAAAPETIVARVLDEGPALMGPEVYVNGAGEITAVTCRCMPPQVRRLVSTAWYELRRLPGDDLEAAALLASQPDVGAALRLPPDF